MENIYLVSLCSSVNFKSEDYDYNHIADLILNEISTLETHGIKAGNMIFRGSLVNVACDNLGANNVFGLVESFSANHYCRYCECSKAEC